MKSKQTFWQRIGLHDFFLKKEADHTDASSSSLTPNAIYHYIIDKFNQSIKELSFAGRVVFYHEYIICLNPEDYRLFMENKRGIFGIIVHESLKNMYGLLKEYRSLGKTVEPSASRWIFRFVSNPEYATGDIGFIGKLLPGNAPAAQTTENLRVTFIPRQTGIAQTFDINPDILAGFHFYSEGYYEVPYREDLFYDEQQVAASANAAPGEAGQVSAHNNLDSSSSKNTPQSSTVAKGSIAGLFARFETIVPDKEFAGKKIEYFMRDEEILVYGKDEKGDEKAHFRIPSDWVNSPHLKIRFNKAEGKFYLASFGEKTVVNEKEIAPSEEDSPQWAELPFNSRIVLNGIVGVNIFKP